MASELETLVAELRSIAAEIARLRPGLVQHAAKVRQAAAEVAGARDGRSATTAALLHQAGRECEAVAAELAHAERAAQHFAGRVTRPGTPQPAGPGSAQLSGRPAPTAAPDETAPLAGARPRTGAAAAGVRPAVFGPADLVRPSAAGSALKGGHGGSGVPPARVPVTDTSRDLVAAYIKAGHRTPDCLPEELVQERCYWMDQSGHPVLRHAEIPNSALISRVLFGHDPITGTTIDWETGSTHKPPRHATTFSSRSALIFAEAQIWSSAELQQALRISESNSDLRCDVIMRASDVFSGDHSKYLHGWTRAGSIKNPHGVTCTMFGADSQIVALYRRASLDAPWTIYTMYPRPQ